MSPDEPITDRALDKASLTQRMEPTSPTKARPWTRVTSLATILFAGFTLFNLGQHLFLGLMQICLGLNQIASFYEGRRDLTRGSLGKASLIAGSFCLLVGAWILGSAVWF